MPSSSRLPAYILYSLTLLVPIFVLPIGVENIFETPKTLLILGGVSLLILLYANQLLKGEAPYYKDPFFNLILLALVFLNIINLFYTQNYYFTKKAAVINISCLLMIFFTAVYAKSLDIKTLFYLMGIGGIIVSIVTILQATGHDPLFGPSSKAMTSTLGNSNYLGSYLIFPLFALSGLIFATRGWAMRVALLVGLGIVTSAVLYARARASWIGLSISIPLFLILAVKISNFSLKNIKEANPKRFFTIIISGLVVVIAAGSLMGYGFSRKYKIADVFNTDTLVVRGKFYQAAWGIVKKHPVIGSGLWSFRNLVYLEQAEIGKVDPEYFKLPVDPKPRRAHNEYLEAVIDGGVISLAVLACFVFVLMRRAWQLARSDTPGIEERMWAVTTFSIMVGILVTAFFSFPFRINSTLFMVSLVLGVQEGMIAKSRDSLVAVQPFHVPMQKIVIGFLCIALITVFWVAGLKPFLGEKAFFDHRKAVAHRNGKAAEEHLMSALKYDPDNTRYAFYAGQFFMKVRRDFNRASSYLDQALVNFNGDIKLWAIYYAKALASERFGSMFEAKYLLEKALYYKPDHKEAKEKLAKINKILNTHDSITIKFR